jgi:hypothetical protein
MRELLVQVYGDTAMKKTAAFKWVTGFAEGRECVTDEEKSDRPATSRTEEKLQQFVKFCVKIVA